MNDGWWYILVGLTLVNYRHSTSAPMRSITQLPRAEAFEVARELYKNSACRAHRRFGPDFPMYYEHRLRTEAWLHAEFVKLGGTPETEHPFYFALSNCVSLKQNFECGDEYRIALDGIDKRHISFTFGDSIAMSDTKQMRAPFLVDELYAHIEACGGDVDAFLESIRTPYVCIEAQLWTDRYFRN